MQRLQDRMALQPVGPSLLQVIRLPAPFPVLEPMCLEERALSTQLPPHQALGVVWSPNTAAAALAPVPGTGSAGRPYGTGPASTAAASVAAVGGAVTGGRGVKTGLGAGAGRAGAGATGAAVGAAVGAAAGALGHLHHPSL